MIFNPNTSIYLLNVPFDATQDNQIDFASLATQQAYFNTKIIKSFLSCTYQRQDGTIRVEANVETLYNCNYVMYQNTNYGSRWFYAFIIGMDYLTNGSTAIKIETDVYQTWLFDCTLHQSFVVREHVNDDDIGVHTIPEKLQLGEYVKNGATQSCGLGTMDIIIATTTTSEGVTGGGMMVAGVYCGLWFYGSSSGANIKTYIGANALMRGGIVSIFMVPHLFTGCGATVELMTAADFDNEIPITLSTVPTSINGYTPRNKKLLCYPYNFLTVHNNSGHAGVFPFEFFLGTPEFEIIGSPTPNGVYMIRPTNKNMGGTETEDKEEAISISGFPVCCWSGDVYSSWMIQHSNQVALSMAMGAGSIVAGMMTGNAVAMGGGMLAVFNQLSAIEDKKMQPGQFGGNLNSGSAIASNGSIDFYLQPKSIRAEYAAIIDEYFDMFGYAVNRLKIPNTVSRPVHNYIKTIDANIEGDIPFDDMSRLKKIYNDGFTIWHNPVNFGNYSLDNAVVGD